MINDPNETNWNEKFQLCLITPNTLEQQKVRNLSIHELSASFMQTAEEFVKKLISERGSKEKTIFSIEGRGVAGGLKVK